MATLYHPSVCFPAERAESGRLVRGPHRTSGQQLAMSALSNADIDTRDDLDLTQSVRDCSPELDLR